jgi:hypothetical protein
MNMSLNLRKKLLQCYLWSMARNGAETWTLWKVDQKHLQSFNEVLDKDGDQLHRKCEIKKYDTESKRRRIC